jgi:membrane protein YdbS with pleckstrin-like domain
LATTSDTFLNAYHQILENKMSPSEEPSPAQRLAAMAVKGANANAEPEESLWSGGYSSKAMIGAWILCLVLSIALIVGMVILPGILGEKVEKKIVWSVGTGVAITFWGIAASIYAYRRLGVFYELTTQRLIHKHGILVRTTDRIELIEIDDVAFTQGPVQRMLNVGCIKLTSSDRSHPQLNLLGIDDVSRVSGLIDDARRKERRRRALHIAN